MPIGKHAGDRDEVELFHCDLCNRFWDKQELDFNRPNRKKGTAECLHPSCGSSVTSVDGGYCDTCPRCGDGVSLTSFQATCNIQIQSDGWDLSSGCDTSEEDFHCNKCGIQVPSDWVFMRMTRKEAAAQMEQHIKASQRLDG